MFYLLLRSLGTKDPVKTEVVILLGVGNFASVRLRQKEGRFQCLIGSIITKNGYWNKCNSQNTC